MTVKLEQFIVSHPTGNTFVRALLSELNQQNRLQKYFTSLGTGRGSYFTSKLFGQRRNYGLNANQLSTQFFPEILRLLPLGRKSQQSRRNAVDRSYQSLDNRVSRSLASQEAKIIHAYEDGARASFNRAKELGILCSYELPIAHWATVRRLLAEEAERLPEWEPTLESTREPEEKLARKEEEITLADCITCPSQFVLQSIPKEIRRNKPCQVAPFGSPIPVQNLEPKRREGNEPLKLLFVGSMSQRKGLADLFEAMKILRREPLKLTVLGQPSMPMEFYRKHYSDFNHLSPCSNARVRQVMQNHDALVLPSIAEGRALVQQEALSCGLPIVVTPNAGGEDLVEEGVTGYLTPPRSPVSLAEKITELIKKRKSLFDLRRSCREKANRYQWSAYARQIIDFCLRISNNPSDS